MSIRLKPVFRDLWPAGLIVQDRTPGKDNAMQDQNDRGGLVQAPADALAQAARRIQAQRTAQRREGSVSVTRLRRQEARIARAVRELRGV